MSQASPPAAALHPEQRTFEAHAGPTTGDGHATLRAAIVPFACWRVDDVRFELDSSIVRPEVQDELAALAALIKQNTLDGRAPPLAVFGHADPTGADDYNHVLSGRRARAVYALLARRVDLWEALFTTPHGGDDWSGDRAVPTFLDALGYGADLAERKRFQGDHGLAVDGIIGPKSRAALFRAYMDHLCPIEVPVDGFLGRGADPGGKADYQGCGEFNPALVLATAEAAASRAALAEANAPNRRVMVFLFRPGTHVDPTRWPCPRAGEGAAACRARFWSDAAARRAPGEQRRRFSETRDTFACRFYHRLSDRSPCEGVLPALRLRLYDLQGDFVANAPYRVIVEGEVRPGRADGRGLLVERFASLPPACTVEWGATPAEAPPAPGAPLDFVTEVRLGIDPVDDGLEPAVHRLHNLGYKLNASLEDNVLAFQADHRGRFGLQLTGTLDDATRAALRAVHGACPDSLLKP